VRREGANVKGVFAWSLFDGFEFNLGMQIRFGLHFVDHSLTRYARKSALWFKAMLSEYSPDQAS
jgi:beta-glucosidase/6-phospho-beta-glucosidase/beta-galactosidase